ncbi:hypothetical protein LZ32DRAFT_32889 [Colletotrichum eremochloae]|nr:hypothetical protein LZ32DRAFT_32889 [Colletotrichum eremochloae]
MTASHEFLPPNHSLISNTHLFIKYLLYSSMMRSSYLLALAATITLAVAQQPCPSIAIPDDNDVFESGLTEFDGTSDTDGSNPPLIQYTRPTGKETNGTLTMVNNDLSVLRYCVSASPKEACFFIDKQTTCINTLDWPSVGGFSLFAGAPPSS